MSTAPTGPEPTTAPASETPSPVGKRIACVRSSGSPQVRVPAVAVGVACLRAS
jgi:hypothetical protein